MILEVQCPECKNTMKYQPQKGELGTKKCVYCSRSFKVSRDRILRRTKALSQLHNPFKTAKNIKEN